MSFSSMSKHTRITTGILGIMMLFIVLFSVFYIADEADHDCRGEDCPICACIQQCENTLHQIGSGTALRAAFILPVVFMLVSAYLLTFDLPQETLISRKVRLNN